MTMMMNVNECEEDRRDNNRSRIAVYDELLQNNNEDNGEVSKTEN